MLTRLKNGSYLDLSLVVGIETERCIECAEGDIYLPSRVLVFWGTPDSIRSTTVSLDKENPLAYANELAALVAKAQGSGQ